MKGEVEEEDLTVPSAAQHATYQRCSVHSAWVSRVIPTLPGTRRSRGCAPCVAAARAITGMTGGGTN